MDFRLSDEERDIQHTIRSFVRNELMPLESQVLHRERNGRPGVTKDELRLVQRKAEQSGYWGIATPHEYGGLGLSAVMQAVIRMEVGRTLVPFVFPGTADSILFECDDEQKQRYLIPVLNGERRSCFALTEPGAGSDATAIRMRARRAADDWVLRGEKTFISGGTEADFAIVFAVTDNDNRHGHSDGITCFLVDRDAGWTAAPIKTMGSWEPASIVFDGVHVPARNVLGEVGEGFRLAMQWIGRGRFLMPARCVGIAERLLEMGIEYAKQRETFGRPIADYQAIQWMLADSAVEIESVKWLTLLAAWQVDNGVDARHCASMAKLSGATMANDVVDRVLQIHGGMGYTKELPIERWYRELRVMRIYEGSDEIQRRTIARNLLRGHVQVGTLGR